MYPRNKIKKSIKKILDLVQTEYASVSKTCNEHEAKSIRTVVSGFYMAYFYIFKKKASSESKKFLLDPDTKITLTIWNLMDTKGIKGILRIAYPKIKYISKYLFKRTEPSITLNIIKQLTESIKNFKEYNYIPYNNVVNFPYKDFDKIIDCDIKGKKKNEESIKVKLYSNIKIIQRKKNETDIFLQNPLTPLNKTRNAINYLYSWWSICCNVSFII